LISEVKVCFLECHNRIISHLTQFVKNFFSSTLGHLPCQGATRYGLPRQPFIEVAQPGLEPCARWGIWEGGRMRLALLPWPGDKMPPIGGLAHPSPRRERGGFDHMVSDGI